MVCKALFLGNIFSFYELVIINLNFFIMKKRNLKSLRLNKKSISSFTLLGGRAPNNGGGDPVGPPQEPHQWFTDGPDRACETFASWCSFTTG